jgi:hypothetical protein
MNRTSTSNLFRLRITNAMLLSTRFEPGKTISLPACAASTRPPPCIYGVAWSHKRKSL